MYFSDFCTVQEEKEVEIKVVKTHTDYEDVVEECSKQQAKDVILERGIFSGNVEFCKFNRYRYSQLNIFLYFSCFRILINWFKAVVICTTYSLCCRQLKQALLHFDTFELVYYHTAGNKIIGLFLIIILIISNM